MEEVLIIDNEQRLKGHIESIQRYFPEFSDARSKLVTKGWDNDVVVLNDTTVFRFPKRDVGRFQAEVQFLQYLSQNTSITAPEYQYLSPDRDFGGYRILDGEELEHELYSSLRPEVREQVIVEIAEFLSTLHSIPSKVAEDAGFDIEEVYWWHPEQVRSMLGELRKFVFPKLTLEEVEWVEAQFNSYLSLSFDLPKTIIHGDLCPDHIFFDQAKGKLTGYIDFADLQFGDPAIDFSGLWDYGQKFVEDAIAKYKGPVDKDFLKRSKFPNLIYMVENMLELEKGKVLPVDFEECRIRLQEIMAKGISL